MKFLEVTTRPELDITNHRLHVDNACTSYSVEKIHIVEHIEIRSQTIKTFEYKLQK